MTWTFDVVDSISFLSSSYHTKEHKTSFHSGGCYTLRNEF